MAFFFLGVLGWLGRIGRHVARLGTSPGFADDIPASPNAHDIGRSWFLFYFLFYFFHLGFTPCINTLEIGRFSTARVSFDGHMGPDGEVQGDTTKEKKTCKQPTGRGKWEKGAQLQMASQVSPPAFPGVLAARYWLVDTRETGIGAQRRVGATTSTRTEWDRRE